MSENDHPEPEQAQPDVAASESRAALLPEEKLVGSDDARRQAEAILAESDERTDGTPDDEIEHRASGDVV